MRKSLKEYPHSICHTCLIRAICHRMCYEQAEQMKNNLEVYFVSEISDIIRKTKSDPVELIIATENTYQRIKDKDVDEGLKIGIFTSKQDK